MILAAEVREGGVAARLHAFGHSPRIVGVDVARGLAILGMFGAHIGVFGAFDWSPGSWLDLVNGRSSILFALLAGVSIAIISGRTVPASGTELQLARRRIVARAVVIALIGAGLEFLETNIAVILIYYAILFLFALPFLRWRSRWLFALAAALAIVMPLIVFALTEAKGDRDLGPFEVVVFLFVTGSYPCLIWIVFVLAGLGVGRLDLSSPRVMAGLLAAGAVLATIGYGVGELLRDAEPSAVFTTEPHSGSPFEVVGSTGFAIGVLGLCLLGSRVIRWALFPIAAVGSMALTAYVAQVVIIAALGIPVPGETDNVAWGWFVLGALVLCSLWAILLGRGPLERLLSWFSRLAAGSPDRESAPAPRP